MSSSFILYALANYSAQPPRSGFEGPKDVEPSPSLIEDTIAGSHGKKEEASQG